MIVLFLQTLSIGGWHVNNKSKYPTYSNEKKWIVKLRQISIGLSNLKKNYNPLQFALFCRNFLLNLMEKLPFNYINYHFFFK